ncbi:hypothetical protein [Nostoc sp. NMS7]|nr:hypothetical protein [Nostoc sp. NMS7]
MLQVVESGWNGDFTLLPTGLQHLTGFRIQRVRGLRELPQLTEYG